MTTTQKYTRNAIVSVLAMVQTGYAEISGEPVKVKNFEQALEIKIGKLNRCIAFIVQAGKSRYSRMPKRYQQQIRNWQSVIRNLRQLESLADARKAVVK